MAVTWGAFPGAYLWFTPGKRSTRDIAVNHGERPLGGRHGRRCGRGCCRGTFHGVNSGPACQGRSKGGLPELYETVKPLVRIFLDRGPGIEPGPARSKREVLTSEPPSGRGGETRTHSLRHQKPTL